MDRSWLALLCLIGRVVARKSLASNDYQLFLESQHPGAGGYWLWIPTEPQQSDLQSTNDTNQHVIADADAQSAQDREHWWIPTTQQQFQSQSKLMEESPSKAAQLPNLVINNQQRFQPGKSPSLASFRVEDQSSTHAGISELRLESSPKHKQQTNSPEYGRQGDGWNRQDRDWQNQRRQDLMWNQLQLNELQHQKSWDLVPGSTHNFMGRNQQVADEKRQKWLDWPDAQPQGLNFRNQPGSDTQDLSLGNQQGLNNPENQKLWN